MILKKLEMQNYELVLNNANVIPYIQDRKVKFRFNTRVL